MNCLVQTFSRSDSNTDDKLSFLEFLQTDALYAQLKQNEFRALDTNGWFCLMGYVFIMFYVNVLCHYVKLIYVLLKAMAS